MALASTNADKYVTVGSATTSDHLNLPPHPSGKGYVLHFSSGGAFVLDVQIGDGTNFADAYYDLTTKVTIDSSTGPRAVKVDGGQCYRMDVTTYNSTITMKALEA